MVKMQISEKCAKYFGHVDVLMKTTTPTYIHCGKITDAMGVVASAD